MRASSYHNGNIDRHGIISCLNLVLSRIAKYSQAIEPTTAITSRYDRIPTSPARVNCDYWTAKGPPARRGLSDIVGTGRFFVFMVSGGEYRLELLSL
jgi:hypothetical protein